MHQRPLQNNAAAFSRFYFRRMIMEGKVLYFKRALRPIQKECRRTDSMAVDCTASRILISKYKAENEPHQRTEPLSFLVAELQIRVCFYHALIEQKTHCIFCAAGLFTLGGLQAITYSCTFPRSTSGSCRW